MPVLRHAYENSAPNFAGDPEEMWRRGITVAPAVQGSHMRAGDADRSSIAGELQLPAYCDFAMELRHRYREHVAKAGSPEQRTSVQVEQDHTMLHQSTPQRWGKNMSHVSPVSQVHSSPFLTYARNFRPSPDHL